MYWVLEICYDEHTGKPSLDLPKIFGIHLLLSGVGVVYVHEIHQAINIHFWGLFLEYMFHVCFWR